MAKQESYDYMYTEKIETNEENLSFEPKQFACIKNKPYLHKNHFDQHLDWMKTEENEFSEIKSDDYLVTTSDLLEMKQEVKDFDFKADVLSNECEKSTVNDEVAPDFSLVKKRIRKSLIDPKTKELILNIYKNEFSDNQFMLLSVIAASVGNRTGVSYRNVERIISEYKHSRDLLEPQLKLQRQRNFDQTAIRRKIHDFFFRNEIPTVEKVLAVVNEDPDLPSFKITTFKKVLKKLNFVFSKCQRNSFLMDRDDIKCWRRDYLTKIKAFRKEKRKVYYLNGNQVNAGQSKSKGIDNLKNLSGKEQGLIVCHIGSEDGFVPGGLWTFKSKKSGDYREEMNGPFFEKWFTNILPMLEENAVIVLDNSPYNTRKLEKIPKTSSNKSVIQEWLRSKDIYFTEDMIKAQLLRLVSENKQRFNKYIVDEIAKEQNKTVLRLPPYHRELNPLEQIWTEIKNIVAVKNTTFEFTYTENIFHDAISNITSAKWKNCVEHVQQKVEIDMWNLDNIIDEMENAIRLDENTTSPSESDSN